MKWVAAGLTVIVHLSWLASIGVVAGTSSLPEPLAGLHKISQYWRSITEVATVPAGQFRGAQGRSW